MIGSGQGVTCAVLVGVSGVEWLACHFVDDAKVFFGYVADDGAEVAWEYEVIDRWVPDDEV